MSGAPRVAKASGALITAAGCGIFALCAASMPYFMTRNVKPLQSREEVRVSCLQ